MAAVLDFEIGTRTVGPGFKNRKCRQILLSENIADQHATVIKLGLADNFADLRLVGISHYPLHPGEIRQILGRALSVTTRDEDPCVGILPMYPAYGLTDIVVGGCGDGASI